MKRIIKKIALFIVMALSISLCGCGVNTHIGNISTNNPSVSNSKSGNYYSVHEARAELVNEGYRVGKEIVTVSNDGHFSCQFEIEPEEYKFRSTSGYIDFTAIYDEEAGWLTEYYIKTTYDWHVSGSWYAETENYYVYLDVIDCDGYTLQANVRADYDSTEGGRGSCGTYTINNDLWFTESGSLECEISCGYPVFMFRLTKDSMTIWQIYDSYKAEFVPN